jgi:DNA repair protein RadA/Sms
MAKSKTGATRTSFLCKSCGNDQARWFGRCPACGEWNTAVEAPREPTPAATRSTARERWRSGSSAPPRPLAEIEAQAAPRFALGIGELDRVLGGGLVPGSLVLVGGDPGIGKSTLLLQAAAAAAAGRRVLYVSGEESPDQVRLRAGRLGTLPPNLLLFCETDLETVLEAAAEVRPAVLVVDSIQTLARADREGGPGTVTQVRECALALMAFAKETGAAVFLVGHVTKDGAVAGPRVLEHIVDAVLYLEGERYQHYRVLRAAKNRFGSTHELGVFEMGERGLDEVRNPSAAFLSEGSESAPGAVVVASVEGSRPLLVELQALVSTSPYGTPQRVTSGFDARRLAVLLAVLERRVGMRLGHHDVFVSVAGGLTLEEPGVDLGVALAVASSYRNRPVLPRTVVVGEVSLAGDVRRVSRLAERAREAAHLGFTSLALPAAQADDPAARALALECVAVSTVREACERLLGARVEPPPRQEAGSGSGGAVRPSRSSGSASRVPA